MKFYNTLSKTKEEFVPLHSGKVGMYVCGPTVYNYIHIGNLRAWVFSDTLRRVLEDRGFEVRMIKNITDVGHLTADDTGQGDTGEDKVEKKAKAEKKSPEEIIEFYTNYFLSAEERMNILPAHYYPKATAHVKQMIKMIEDLIARGHAYEKNGSVFLDVTTFPKYGRLSGNTLENLKVGARLEEHPDKKHPWDFALWLRAPKEHLMRWPSPWSEGYPGWHIECSAMSMEYLGNTLDIHTGGEDNIFPHHEAEIVQSEGVTGQPFSRYWLHARHILVNGEKMSKSKGNFYLLEDILKRGYTPMDFRMLLIAAHYRSQMNFTWEALDQAKKNKESLLRACERVSSLPENASGFSGAEHLAQIQEALADDLNTPLALTIALDLTTDTNRLLDNGDPVDTKGLKHAFERIFFLFGLREEAAEIPEEIKKLADERAQARRNKDFARSDELREKIAKLGFLIEDRGSEYRLERK